MGTSGVSICTGRAGRVIPVQAGINCDTSGTDCDELYCNITEGRAGGGAQRLISNKRKQVNKFQTAGP